MANFNVGRKSRNVARPHPYPLDNARSMTMTGGHSECRQSTAIRYAVGASNKGAMERRVRQCGSLLARDFSNEWLVQSVVEVVGI
jgi:hypothetical protein